MSSRPEVVGFTLFFSRCFLLLSRSFSPIALDLPSYTTKPLFVYTFFVVIQPFILISQRSQKKFSERLSLLFTSIRPDLAQSNVSSLQALSNNLN